MNLLIALVTHNRLEYTKRTLESLRDTLQVPHFIVAVDNASTDGTQSWLYKKAKVNYLIENETNLYPGAATNQGWAKGIDLYPQATHLMRCDNDMHFEPGWDLKAKEYFQKIDRLGQLGLDFDGGENKTPEFYNGMGLIEWPGCVGGPSIIRREIYDNGARYDETPWEGSRSRVQEDSRFSRKLKDDGWLVGHMDTRLSWTFANKKNWWKFPEYYKKTMYDRAYDENVKYIEKFIK